MPLVVADAGPPHYLALIGAIDLLPQLFERIVIPSQVRAELSHAETPALVREWVASAPAWLHVLPATDSGDAALVPLDAGERAVLALAASLGADLVLMDDRAGVRAARRQGFAVIGTLGLLDLAARRGLIDLSGAFTRLRATNFRYRTDVLDELLARWREGGQG